MLKSIVIRSDLYGIGKHEVILRMLAWSPSAGVLLNFTVVGFLYGFRTADTCRPIGMDDQKSDFTMELSHREIPPRF
jgi:hypothetical protein